MSTTNQNTIGYDPEKLHYMPYVACESDGSTYSITNNDHDCMVKCRDDPNCKYWSYNISGNTCYNGYNEPTCTSNNMYISGIIGDSRNQELPVPVVQRKSMRLPASFLISRDRPITNVIANGDNDCESICLNDSSCNAWTYDKTNSQCYISKGIVGNAYGVPSATSGYAYYEIHESPNTNYSEQYLPYLNCSYVPPDKTITTDNASACQNQCANDPNCKHWTYVKDSKRCYIGNTEGKCRMDPSSVSGFITDRNNLQPIQDVPPPPPIYIVTNNIKGFAFAPQPLNPLSHSTTMQYNVKSADECRNRCTGYEFCKGWTYLNDQPNTKNCFIVDDTPGVLIHTDNAVSGKIFNVKSIK